MFQIRQLLLQKKKREWSEYKAIYVIKEYLLLIYYSLQKEAKE
ncbi:transposase [Bacillus toyonensis]|nr:IS231-related transposase [Bacillus cereus Rock1-3]EEL40912.1 IS231-related transposase [Bacillus cereus Rock3-29]OKO54898.1 transposase [Bacillus toyonensis]